MEPIRESEYTEAARIQAFEDGLLNKRYPSTAELHRHWREGQEHRGAVQRSIEWAEKQGSYGTVHTKRLADFAKRFMKGTKS